MRLCSISDLSSCLLFGVVALHPQVQTLAHFVEEIGAAFIFAVFYVGIGIITEDVLYFYA